MNKQQITDEAIKYCSRIDFTDDKNLNKKGRQKVCEWSKQDFIAGANWMQEQLRLSNVSESVIKPISTELTPELEQYIAHLKWVEGAMREYATKILMIPKELIEQHSR